MSTFLRSALVHVPGAAAREFDGCTLNLPQALGPTMGVGASVLGRMAPCATGDLEGRLRLSVTGLR